MSESGSSDKDDESSAEDQPLPLPEVSDADEVLEAEDQPSAETSLTAISINQRINQIQLLIPSLVEAVGDLADRHKDLAVTIVDDIIGKGKHREEIETAVVKGNSRRADRAQILSWIIAAMALVFGFVLLMTDRSAAGIVFLVGAIGPLVGVNIFGRISSKRERLEKMAMALAPAVGEPPPTDENR